VPGESPILFTPPLYRSPIATQQCVGTTAGCGHQTTSRNFLPADLSQEQHPSAENSATTQSNLPRIGWPAFLLLFGLKRSYGRFDALVVLHVVAQEAEHEVRDQEYNDADCPYSSLHLTSAQPPSQLLRASKLDTQL